MTQELHIGPQAIFYETMLRFDCTPACAIEFGHRLGYGMTTCHWEIWYKARGGGHKYNFYSKNHSECGVYIIYLTVDR